LRTGVAVPPPIETGARNPQKHKKAEIIRLYNALGSNKMANPKTDDLEAVRAVVEAIGNFKPEEQERIIRWVAEKLGLPQPFLSTAHTLSIPSQQGSAPSVTPHVPASPPGGVADIRTFIAEKKPRNDVQFAAAVAYYYRFEAPPADRKEAIDKEDLQQAARKAGRERFTNPRTTLFNAHTLGLLDKGAEKATFTINSVGENLIAMTLPDGSAGGKPGKKKKKKKKVKKAARAAARVAPLKKAKKA
jgi:hypothetical protein